MNTSPPREIRPEPEEPQNKTARMLLMKAACRTYKKVPGREEEETALSDRIQNQYIDAKGNLASLDR